MAGDREGPPIRWLALPPTAKTRVFVRAVLGVQRTLPHDQWYEAIRRLVVDRFPAGWTAVGDRDYTRPLPGAHTTNKVGWEGLFGKGFTNHEHLPDDGTQLVFVLTLHRSGLPEFRFEWRWPMYRSVQYLVPDEPPVSAGFDAAEAEPEAVVRCLPETESLRAYFGNDPAGNAESNWLKDVGFNEDDKAGTSCFVLYLYRDPPACVTVPDTWQGFKVRVCPFAAWASPPPWLPKDDPT